MGIPEQDSIQMAGTYNFPEDVSFVYAKRSKLPDFFLFLIQCIVPSYMM